ncbi:hypothetical protein [Bacillus thuringiensis]|uniref:hypothetical protein n=1 Tax=Bacillus thuringiensis TaxID=1428 RepID=UPI0026E3ED78|nr:hypothetical protein [Bacillus thuringiensis]MDO6631949.1 hypothetical protein [Bacillus thuringiensis]MDO6661551.1 hypothetical protein [Bacillus thuringiensis]MDO6702128.1 hypothetical protein [Bacillus thuringiensis]
MALYKVEFSYDNGNSAYVLVEADMTHVQITSHFGNKLTDCAAISYVREGQSRILALNNVTSITIASLTNVPNSVNIKDFNYYEKQ